MKIAAFIPIKQKSERVQGKNFKQLGDKKLYEYMIENAIEADCFDTIYIDTDSEEIKEYAKNLNLEVIERLPELTTKFANGNDLIVYNHKIKPNYDYYFQLFVTAPFLSAHTIAKCVDDLVNSTQHDSVFTVLNRKGFFWMNDNPINYRPGVLPRSQDLQAVLEESTGLYGITKEALNKYKCRIGEYPALHEIDFIEAVDINTEDDLLFAELVLKMIDEKKK